MTSPAAAPVRPGPPDQADRDRISRDGLDRTLFVEAGAGTGKTTQLVARISNLVLEHDVPLSEIAAITFTEAAATELQSRIRIHFEQRLARATDLFEQQRCRVALADADRAAISTLHGFASRLLGEFAVAAALPPRVRVLDEVSSQLAAEDRWQRFVDSLYDDEVHTELLVRTALLAIPLEPRYLGQSSLRDVAAQLNQNWDLLDVVVAAEPAPLRPIDFRDFDDAVARLAELGSSCLNPADLLLTRVAATVLPEAQAVVALDPERKLRALQDVGDRWAKGLHVGNKKHWVDVEQARQVAGAVAAARKRLLARTTDEVLRHLLVLIARFVLDGAEARRAEGGLEFHDLLVLARNMLRTNPEARAALHRRYRHLLLDEFQDTDPIQVELAVLIATAVAGPGDTRWYDLAVDEGRLFFVGDPKQSIYRFRRADIELFLRARDRFGSDGGLARLTANFRTVGPVLDWVNAFFAVQMADEVAGAQPAYEALQAMRSTAAEHDHRPLHLGGLHPDPKISAGALRELEAADVAATARSILAEPDRWPVYDELAGAWRPAGLADVTILLPTRTSLPYLRDALDRADVAYRLATGTLVYDTQEVRDVLSVLRAVDDPSDEISLVAALRSPLYGCSDVDLYTYRRAGGRWDLRTQRPATVAADHPVALAYGHLRSLWSRRWWLTPSAMVAQVLRDRHAFLLGFGAVRPADVWRRLRFLADQARAFEEAGGGGLRAFVDWARLQGADGARVHEPLLPETDEAAVRIMTIHGAKGLEFPITILSGMTTLGAAARTGVSVLWRDDGPPELKVGGSIQTAHHEPRADLEGEMDAHEKLRLLYVAVTRARDHLVVSCHHKAASRPSYAQQLATFFTEEHADLCRRPIASAVVSVQPVLSVPAVVSVPAAVSSPTGPAQPAAPSHAGGEPQPMAQEAPALAERVRWQAERDALLAPYDTPRVLSATAVARRVQQQRQDPAGPASPTIDEDDDHADEDEPGHRTAAVPRRRGRTGSAVGRAVHGTLQLVDLADPRHVSELVAQQCSAEAIGGLEPSVERLVRAALSSDVVRRAAQHRHHKELYVAAPLGDRVIEGYVDLLIETPEGLVVVDYKTDAANSPSEIEAKLDAYELQAASYAVALEAVTATPVVDCVFVFCRPSGPIERPVRDLAAAKDQVRRTLETA